MKKITNLELGSIIYFLTNAFFIGISFNSLIVNLRQNAYIGVLIGGVLGIIPLLFYIYYFNYKPKLSINEKNICLFGKKLGNIINILISLFTLFLIIILFSNLVTFIQSDYLSKTPLILIIITFIAPIYYSVYTGLKSICRTSLIFLFLIIILSLFTDLSLSVQIDINNFKPLSFESNYIYGFISYVSYNVIPLYLINIIPKYEIVNNNKTNKYIVLFYIISFFSILVNLVDVIGIFGINLSLLYKYPEFQILKKVSLIGLSSRIDSIIFAKWIFSIIITIIIGMYYIVETSKSFFKEKNNIFLTIYCFIVISFALLLPNDLFINFLSINILSIIFLIFFIIIFILLYFKINNSKKIKSN